MTTDSLRSGPGANGRTSRDRARLPVRAHLPACGAAAASGVPVLDVVVPVYNEGEGPPPLRPAPPRPPLPHLPVRLPHHRRGQRVHRFHPRRRCRARGGAARGAVRAAGGEGARAGAAYRLVGVRRPGPRLHGRRPLHRPQRPAPAGRPADLRPLRPGHRLAARTECAGGARVEAGVHLARLQPHPALLPRRRIQRRPVRVQGGPQRGGRAAAADGGGQRLVLRHRAAGPRRAGPALAYPRGAR
ncbi:hypothetical protein SMICM304S_11460 [Streptomyces microflavus]